ncbi:hypothetical protein BH09SUM1_BH09SUM1_20210 [soil metagenome]
MRHASITYTIAIMLAGGIASAQPMPGKSIADEKLLSASARSYLLDGPTLMKVNRRATNLVAEDLNGDGHVDLCVVSNEKSMLELFIQKPDHKAEEAAFERTEVPLDRVIRDAKAVDVDGDGRMDLMLAASPAKLVIMYQDAKGRLQTPKETELLADHIVTGDLNGDGREDILLVHEKKFMILDGTARGVKLEPRETVYTTGDPARDPMLIDIDNDGRTDIVFHDAQRFQDLVIRLQSPEGKFPSEFRIGSAILRVVAPMVGAKGERATLAAVQNNTRQIVQLALREPREEDLKSQAVPVSEPQTIAFSPELRAKQSMPLVIDYDGDGRQDLLLVSADLSVLRLLHQTKAGSLIESTIPSLQGLQSAVSVPDQKGAPALVFFSPEEKAIGFARYDKSQSAIPFPKLLPIAGEPQAVTVLSIAGKQSLAGIFKTDADPKLTGYPISDTGEPGAAMDLMTLAEGAASPFKGLTVKGLDAMDVNRDGRTDLIVYLDFKPARVLLQNEAGKFEELTATSGVLEGLLSGARLGSIHTVTLDDDKGQQSVLALKEKFARAFHIDKDNNIAVGYQFNGRNGTARLVDATEASLRSKGSHEIVLLDRGNKCLTIYGRGKEGKEEILSNIDLDDTPYSALRAIDLDNDGKDDLVLIADDRVSVIYSHPFFGGLETIATASTAVEDGGYGVLYTGKFLSGAGTEIAGIEMKDNLMEFFAPGKDANGAAALNRFYQFDMFDSDNSIARRSNLDAQPEPRDLMAVDLDDDGKNEIVALMHDNLVIYKPQDKKPETASGKPAE